MRISVLAMIGVAVACQANVARGVDWFRQENNEPPGAAAFRFWGFIQPQFIANQGGAVEGIKSPSPGLTAYDGQTALFNYVGPDFTAKNQAQIFRARPGIRGVIPGTDETINYFVLAEFGNNGITETRDGPHYRYHPVLTDATVTFNTPLTRIRVGLGRLPLGEEAIQGEPVLNYVSLTNVTDSLLNERFQTPYYSGLPEVPTLGVPMTQMTQAGLPGNKTCATPAGHCVGSMLTGSVGAFRDLGVELYDWFDHGNWEYSYAVMVGDGHGVDVYNNGNYDISAHLQATYVFGGAGTTREDASVYIWHQDGTRNYDSKDYSRIREGVGAIYSHHGLRLAGEYIRARGMIYYGYVAPFNFVGGGAFEPVEEMALASSNKADGYYVDVGQKFCKRWEVDLRFDSVDKLYNSAYDQRRQATWTIGAQYFYSSALRFVVDYAIRSNLVVNPGAYSNANQHTQLTDAALIAQSIGNQLQLQLTYAFGGHPAVH